MSFDPQTLHEHSRRLANPRRPRIVHPPEDWYSTPWQDKAAALILWACLLGGGGALDVLGLLWL